MTGLLCKVRSSDTALDRKSEGGQVLGVTQHFLLAACMCVFGKHTLPENESEGVSKRYIVFLGQKRSACGICLCAWIVFLYVWMSVR